jgi:hypothetical protein
MANLRRTFVQGRMESDLDERLIEDGLYTHALNVVILDSEGSNSTAVENSLSNVKLTNLPLGPNPITLLSYSNEITEKIYWGVKSDTGCYLIEYDPQNDVAVIVLEDTRPIPNRVLDWREDFLITGVDMMVSEDFTKSLMLITDDNIPPLCINIERAKTYAPNGFEKEDIYLIKKPPRFAPKIQPTYVEGTSNYIEEKFLSFSYAYKYLDGEYSALSSYANYVFYPYPFKLDYEVLDNMGMLNSYNAVRITVNTGDKRVTDIQVVFKATHSNNLYIIETFNKENEGWGDNENRSFVFSNNKIYTVLPETEIYRPYDNVPHKAKALVVIGNLIVMGNYLEGFNLTDIKGNQTKLSYILSIISTNLEGISLLFNIGTSGAISNNLFDINFTGTSLIEGSKITLFISLKNSQSPDPRFYNNNFSFILNKAYADASALAQDPDFIFFIEKYITNIFIANYTINPINNSKFESNTTFLIDSFTATHIVIKSPELVFRIDDTPADTSDNPANTHLETINWGFERDSNVLFYEKGSTASIKTNRSLEVGFIYLDPYNRATTVQTQLNNTIFLPHDLAQSRNRLKIAIDAGSNPPATADRYKIVIKSPKLEYQTIYATTFYADGLFRWIKLENDNKDKVAVGDILIFKSDSLGFVPSLIKVKVLEIKDQPKEFIEGNVDTNGDQIKELSGLFMKIKIPAGINMDYVENSFIERTGQNQSKGDNFNMLIGPFTDDVAGVLTDIPILQGTRIDIYLHNVKFGSSGGEHTFERTFFSTADYDNFHDWYEAEVSGTGDFNDSRNGVKKFTGYGPYWDNKWYLEIWNELNGNGQHKSYMDGYVKIYASNGLIILETDEKKTIAQEIYFETEQTFEIINGFHQGNLQNQTDVLPAVIELDFFNCFAQGNGAESYIIKDAFNKNSLNIDLRPSGVQIEKFKAIRRYADLTYSDVFVESGSINGLNVFNTATLNYKELDKQNGSIQKLLSRDNDIVVLKERKAAKVMFRKDILYNADGTSNIVDSSKTLGSEVTYLGSNGVGKHPEGVAVNDFQIYYPNPEQGVITRLSIDGTTPIVTGMKSFFKTLFQTQSNAKMLGCYDPHKNHYVFAIGEEPEKVLQLTCGNTITKENQVGVFKYNFKINDLSGDIILNYNITSGHATIEALFDATNHVVSNVTGLGNITIPRTSLVENIVEVTVTQVGTEILSYQISNVCPVGSQLKIVSIIVNDTGDISKNIVTQFKWGSSPFYNSEDIFTAFPVSKFVTETGTEGVGKFPLNNTVFTMQSIKNALTTGEFKLTECNRMGYLVSNSVYTVADLTAILNSATFLTISGDAQTKGGSFLFNRSGTDEILYLIWDYSDRSPVLTEDFASLFAGGSVTVDVMLNDIIVPADLVIVVPTIISVSIFANPLHGTAIVNLDNTITYTHDGSANLQDTIVYEVSNGLCSSISQIHLSISVLQVVANDDIGIAINTGTGGTAYVNVLQNDTLGGVPINPSDVIVEFISSSDAGITLVGNDVIVAAGVPIGDQTLTYRVSQVGNLSNFDTAVVSVTIVPDDVIVFDADYAVFTYKFNDGRDLDTRSRVVTPNIGQDTNNEYVGWSRLYGFPNNVISGDNITNIENNYIESAGDNTGLAPAFESVVINIKKIKEDFPLENIITIDLRGFWYAVTGVLAVNLKGVFYKGGTIIKHGASEPIPTDRFTFSNPTAIDSIEFVSPDSLVVNNNPAASGGGTVPGSSPPEMYAYSGLRIATFSYDRSTASGSFNMNDTTTPKV